LDSVCVIFFLNDEKRVKEKRWGKKKKQEKRGGKN